jgi:hypothetical protein
LALPNSPPEDIFRQDEGVIASKVYMEADLSKVEFERLPAAAIFHSMQT